MSTDPPASPRLEILADIEQAIWQDLACAVQEPRHLWRTPCLLTSHQQAPEGRVVVLRHADTALRTLAFYTDARSPKVRQIRGQPHGMLVFWNPVRSWQLRVRCTLSVATTGSAVEQAWEQLRNSRTAGDYLGERAPGEKLACLPLTSESVPLPTASPAPHHLAIISAQVQSLDWLELARTGHRRAAFSGEGAAWLQC